MNRLHKPLLVFAVCFLMVQLAWPMSSSNYSIDWSTPASGGGPSSSTSYQVDDTTGQSAIGISNSSGYQLCGGYQCGTAPLGTTDTAAVFRVTKGGDVLADGGYYCGPGDPGCWHSGSADIAEAIQVTEPVEASDVVALDPNHPGRYRKARESYSTLASGVISTKPAFRLGISKSDFMNQSENLTSFLNASLRLESISQTTLSLSSKPNKPYEPNELNELTNPAVDIGPWTLDFGLSFISNWYPVPDTWSLTMNLGSIPPLKLSLLNPNPQTLDPKITLNFEPFSTLTLPKLEDLLFHQFIAQTLTTEPLLALMGVVPVKATTENGPIKPGDLLTTSSKPGYAMACRNKEKCAGAIIGKALEPLKEKVGVIRMLIMR